MATLLGMAVSRASIALDALLKAGGEAAKAIDGAFHRTQIWNYRTGRQKPDAEGVSRLHRITNGGVPGDGWEDIELAAPFPLEPDAPDPSPPATPLPAAE